MARHPRTLAELRDDPRVDEIWQEYDGCFHPDRPSYWVALADGWKFEGAIVLHEPTVKDLCMQLHGVYEEEWC